MLRDTTSTASPSEGILRLFEDDAPLPCSLERYLKRIVKYGETSPCNVVIALIYLERVKRNCPSLKITPYNAKCLVLIAIMIATKFADDSHYNNRYWAQIGELELAEMNHLELAFLAMLNMSCFVHREEYDAFIIDAML